MSKEEYESQQMGELSETNFLEHQRPMFPGTENAAQYGAGTPPDIEYQNRMNKEGVRADPATLNNSTPVFNVRPLNAQDFIKADKKAISYNSGFTNVPFKLDFIVPQGYIAILKKFKFSYGNPIFPIDVGVGWEVGPSKTRIEIDGVPVPYFDDFIWLGQNVSEYQDCYILANSGQTLSLYIEVGAVQGAPPLGTAYNDSIIGVMYGNLLLKKGSQLNTEPFL